jgi:hypothetical protein
MSGKKDFKARYECSQGISGQNGGIYNSPEANMMTEPKLTGRKSGFLFGIRTGEQNKTYTLSVEAASTADATDKLTQAIHTIKNNELVIYHGYGGRRWQFQILHTEYQP